MPPDGILDSVLNDFQSGVLAYYNPLLVAGVALLGSITLLQFSYLCARAALTRDFHRIWTDFMVGILRVGAVWGVLATAAGWGAPIVDTCRAIAEQVSGLSPYTLTPSGVWGLGAILFI
jgi:hypothetical protein